MVTITVPTLGVMSGSARLGLAGMVLLVAMLAAAPRLRQRSRPSWLHRLVHGTTVAILAWALANLGTARIDAVLIIVMLGIFNRFALRTGTRDDFIIVAAASVLMTMATTITPGVTFLPLVLTFVPALLWTLLTSTILARGRDARDVERFAREPLPRLKAALGLTGIAFMLVGYIGVSFFPRYNFGRAFAVGAFASFAGADRSMTLGMGGLDAQGDGSVVIRVTPPDGASPSSTRNLYARVFALDRFDGRTWEATAPWPARGVDRPARDARGSWDWARVKVRRLVPRGEPHPVVLFGRSGPKPVSLRDPRQSPGGTWYSSIPQASLRFEYSVALGADGPLPPPADRSRLLALPEDLSPKIRALAEELTDGHRGFESRAGAILDHFDRQFTYSLEPLEGTSDEPLERFLFEARSGHCELYAGAVAVLLRAAQIPARVVTGYYGGWWNAAAGQLEFVGEDAHAWVEAYDPNRGWVWLDATPPDLRTARQGKAFAWFRDLYDWAESLWYTYVIDYDENRRRRMVERLSNTLASGFELLDQPLEVATGRTRGLSGWWFLLIPVLAIPGVVAATRLRSDPRRLGRRLRRTLRLDDRKTLRRALSSVPTEHRGSARRAVELYEALRFGRPKDRPSSAAVLEAIRALEKRTGRGFRPGSGVRYDTE